MFDLIWFNLIWTEQRFQGVRGLTVFSLGAVLFVFLEMTLATVETQPVTPTCNQLLSTLYLRHFQHVTGIGSLSPHYYSPLMLFCNIWYALLALVSLLPPSRVPRPRSRPQTCMLAISSTLTGVGVCYCNSSYFPGLCTCLPLTRPRLAIDLVLRTCNQLRLTL